MKTLEVCHPCGQWVEVLKTTSEEELQSFLNRYVLDFGLRCRVIG